jgi:hypothetical protein
MSENPHVDVNAGILITYICEKQEGNIRPGMNDIILQSIDI